VIESKIISPCGAILFQVLARPSCRYERIVGEDPPERLRNARDSLASLRDCDYIRAILIGFAGRTKEKEWAENPLFSFVKRPADPKRRENKPA
jgi:hypothetical protein